MNKPLYQIQLVSRAFLNGRATAQRDMLRVHGSVTPSYLIDRQSTDFRNGYMEALVEFDALPEANQQNLLRDWAQR